VLFAVEDELLRLLSSWERYSAIISAAAEVWEALAVEELAEELPEEDLAEEVLPDEAEVSVEFVLPEVSVPALASAD
jgi:hypothetical protein